MLPLKWAIGWITEMAQLFFLLNQFHRTFTKNCLNLTLYNCLSLGTAAPWSTFIYLSLISDWWKISHLHIWGTQLVLLPGNFDVEYPGELQNKQLLMRAEYKIQGNKVQQLMTSRSSCQNNCDVTELSYLLLTKFSLWKRKDRQTLFQKRLYSRLQPQIHSACFQQWWCLSITQCEHWRL